MKVHLKLMERPPSTEVNGSVSRTVNPIQQHEKKNLC